VTDAPEPSRRSFRQELPTGLSPITATGLVKYVRLAWRQARITRCTDAIAILVESPGMALSERPRVFSAGMTTLRGLAAMCAVLLANALRGDGTDDPRLLAAHKALDDFVRNPPKPPRPSPTVRPRW
jgi:hypothetical protein